MLSRNIFSQKLKGLIKDKKNSRFLLAVSGGVDSMVLLHLFSDFYQQQTADNRLPFEVAHINYKLRGEDSDLDQKLVEDFCRKNKIKCHTYEVSEKDNCPKNGSIQLWARELRYRFFREIQEREGVGFLVTAHHLNDQLETFFINLSRGSGLVGLAGIPADENDILRPLLAFSKEEIYAFAQKNKIPFREDISNQKNDYLRNKIRNKIVPELTEIKSDFLPQFAKSLSILGEAKDFVKSQINQILEKLTLEKNDEVWILDRKKIAQKSDFEKFEILRKFGFENETENAKIFIAETGKKFISNNFELLINRNELIFRGKEKIENCGKFPILEQVSEDEYQIVGCQYPKAQSQTWFFDKNKIKFPLRIREKREGDVIYLAGMLGKKKVSKFLKDEKVPQYNKEKVKILCDAENNIMGVVPLRQDRILMAQKDQKDVIKVSF